jgi:hypothetical protein
MFKTQHRRWSTSDVRFRSRIGIKLGLSVSFSLGFALAFGFASRSVAGDQGLFSRSAYGIGYTTIRSRVRSRFWTYVLGVGFWGVGFIILGVGLNFGRWLLIPGRWQGNLSSAGSLEASTATLKGSSPQIHLPPFSLPFLPSFPLTSTRSVPSHLQARRRTPYQFKRRRETLSLAVPLAVQSSNGLHRVFLSSGWIGRGRR